MYVTKFNIDSDFCVKWRFGRHVRRIIDWFINFYTSFLTKIIYIRYIKTYLTKLVRLGSTTIHEINIFMHISNPGIYTPNLHILLALWRRPDLFDNVDLY